MIPWISCPWHVFQKCEPDHETGGGFGRKRLVLGLDIEIDLPIGFFERHLFDHTAFGLVEGETGKDLPLGIILSDGDLAAVVARPIAEVQGTGIIGMDVFKAGGTLVPEGQPFGIGQFAIGEILTVVELVFGLHIGEKVVVGLQCFGIAMLGDPLLDPVDLLLLFCPVQSHIGLFPGRIFIPGIIEKGHGIIVFFVLYRVVGVTVALYATDRGALPDLESGIGTVDHGGYPELFIVGAPFVVVHGVPVERGRDQLVYGRVGQQVARQLLDGELIVGHVLVERLDHPIAVRPHTAAQVFFIALGIGIACQIKPPARPFFTKSGLGQEAVYIGCIGDLAIGKGIEQLLIGREPGKIQGQPSGDGVGRGFAIGLERLPFHPGQYESIDVIFNKGPVRSSILKPASWGTIGKGTLSGRE